MWTNKANTQPVSADPADSARGTRENTVTPSAYGYVSIPPALHPDDGDAALRAWTHDLADLAAKKGYAFAGVFADLRGQTETGLYRLLEVLREGAGVVVVSPDLEHLRHAGCLFGADSRTASRYLRARLLLASDNGTGHGHSPTSPVARQHRAPTTTALTPALVGTGSTRPAATVAPAVRR